MAGKLSITLRKRENGKRISLYLDIYQNGKRRYEYLGISLKKEPEDRKLNSKEKTENKRLYDIAENVRIKRLNDYVYKRYMLVSKEFQLMKFIDYAEVVIIKKIVNISSRDILTSLLKLIKCYDRISVKVGEVNKIYVEGFKHYLKRHVSLRTGKPLSANSQSLYYERFKMVIREGCKSGVIPVQVLLNVGYIKGEEVSKDYLELYEIKSLMKSICSSEVVKQSFLFMCLTGLRFGDCSNLKGSDIIDDGKGKYTIRYRQEKTNIKHSLPLCPAAYEIIRNRLYPEKKIFVGLSYSSHNNSILQEWVKSTGISKKITFHCARHTFATLLIKGGNDIYIVSQLLGHKSVKTTEIYVNLKDKEKYAAVIKIAI